MSDNQSLGPSDRQGSDSSVALPKPAADECGSDVSTANVEDAGSVIISASSSLSVLRARPNDDTVIRKRSPFGAPSQRGSDSARDDDVAKQLVGTMLGYYRLEDVIGGGGMGVVFRSTDTRLHRIVAIKVLTYRDGKDEEIVRRFQQEAQSAAQLAHENIAQVYDVGEDDGWNYIAFEYIDGQNIRDLVIRDGPLPVATAISYTMQAAEALNHACERAVVHRDIKPSNLIVTQEGQVKLVDMGLARLRQVESTDDDLTESGMTLGTFDYISPEQGQDPRSADIRSDLYSLGCTLYYMLTGKAPFPHGTVLQKLLHHASETPPDPRGLRSDIPDELVAVVNKLLAKKPEQRYQRPVELVAALQAVADREGMVVHSSLARAPHLAITDAPTVFLQQLPWLVPLCLLLIAVLAIGGFPWAANSNDTFPPFELPQANTDSLVSAKPILNDNGVARDDSAANLPVVDDAGDASRDGADDVPVGTEVTATQKPTLAGGVGPPAAANARGTPSPAPLAHVPMPVNIPRSDHNEISHLIVIEETDADAQLSPPRDTRVARSLDEALRLSNQLPNLREIEIRAHDAFLREPVTLVRHDLIIRAGEDYSPVVRIQPTASADWTSVFSLIGGSVRFQDLFLIVDVRERSDLSGNLFQLADAAKLNLDYCWIRVEAGSRRTREDAPFAVFEFIAPENVTPSAEGPELHITSCVIQGEMMVARSTEATPFLLDWSNGFLATSDRFLTVGGAVKPLAADAQITVQLDHVTAVTDKGLIRFEAKPAAPELITIDSEFTNCIFVGSPSQPLVEQVAFDIGIDRLEDFFRFQGRRNFYEDITIFWQKLVLDSLDSQRRSLHNLTFPDWRGHWDEPSSRRNAVQWQHLPTFAPRHTLVPDDFALRNVPGNPARLSISGMERSADAGMTADRLPPPPVLVGGFGDD